MMEMGRNEPYMWTTSLVVNSFALHVLCAICENHTSRVMSQT